MENEVIRGEKQRLKAYISENIPFYGLKELGFFRGNNKIYTAMKKLLFTILLMSAIGSAKAQTKTQDFVSLHKTELKNLSDSVDKYDALWRYYDGQAAVKNDSLVNIYLNKWTIYFDKFETAQYVLNHYQDTLGRKKYLEAKYHIKLK